MGEKEGQGGGEARTIDVSLAYLRLVRFVCVEIMVEIQISQILDREIHHGFDDFCAVC